MIIDCHAHLVPQSWFHPNSPKSIFDLDGLFKQQDEAGVDITVFGNNWIRSPDGYDPLKVVQEFNAHAAELTEKYPKLKMVCAHVGGALAMLPGRYGFGYELRKDNSFGPWEPDVMSRPPASYMKQLYFDTVCYHPPAVQCAIDTIGVDHVVFGSDSPPVPLPLARAVDTVKQL